MIQIGNVLYTAECRHNEIQVRQDYPAQLNEKSISLLGLPVTCALVRLPLDQSLSARHLCTLS